MGFKNSLEGTQCQDTRNTFRLPATVTEDDIGKAVTIDTTVDNGAKLADDGAPILGKLESVEIQGAGANAVVYGMVTSNGGFNLPVKSGATIAKGDVPVGAGNGEIKGGTASTDLRFIVTSTEKLATESSVTVYRQ